MAIKQKKNGAEQGAAKAPAKRAARTAARTESPAALRAEERHEKALAGFDPSVSEFLSRELGLNLGKLSTEILYDLQQGKLTREPLECVVVPLSYDRDSRRQVALPAIKALASLRIIVPMEGGKPVPIDDKHKVFVQSVPCRPYIAKDDVASGPEPDQAPDASVAAQENPVFSESELRALEGIGISRERMFGGFNHIDRETKLDMKEGNIFPVDGAVRTSFGLLNVIGEGRLRSDGEGNAVAEFQSSYPEKRTENLMLDILDSRINGNLELDFFRRSADGKVISSVDGRPFINDAARNLLTFGMAMEPVRGWVHNRTYDSKEKKFVETREQGWYQVTAVNGNLFATRMKEAVKKDVDGKDVALPPEVASARVRDGKVFVDGKTEPLEFATERDMQDFLSGRGGLVKDATYRDMKAGKDVKYDAFVVPDNTRGGYARQFTPESTKKILAQRDSRRQTTRKRQNFKIGL